MMPPVGVGAMSRGPNGNAGLTITTGSPLSAKRIATRSLCHFVRMYGFAMSNRLNLVVSSARPPSTRPIAAIELV